MAAESAVGGRVRCARACVYLAGRVAAERGRREAVEREQRGDGKGGRDVKRLSVVILHRSGMKSRQTA